MFADRLSAIARRVDGVQALLLIGDDGLPVESEVVDPNLDLEMMSAEITSLVRDIEANHRELDLGPVQSFEVETERYRLLLSRIAAKFFLLLVSDPGSALGRARFELRRATLAFRADLES